MSDSDVNIPSDVEESANAAVSATIPSKSRNRYEGTYEKFEKWCQEQGVKNVCEKVMLAYFETLKNYKASTVWTTYSMLKAELNVKRNIDIQKYTTLVAFIKKRSAGYHAKKSMILTRENFEKFIREADDREFLFAKVAMIIGVAGACRKAELTNMRVRDVVDEGNSFKITIPNAKTNVLREFVVTNRNITGCRENFVDIIRKYVKLRPQFIKHNRFFIKYDKNKCGMQPIGINTFGSLPKLIAQQLGLPNAAAYTGHCFRRSSASLLADSGAVILKIQRHGGWKSCSVAEGYAEDSLANKRRIANNILGEHVSGSRYNEENHCQEVKIEVDSSDDEVVQSYGSFTPVSETERKSVVDEDSATSENSFVADSEQSSNMPEFVSTTGYLKQEEEEEAQSIRKQTTKVKAVDNLDDFSRKMAQDVSKEDNFEIFGKYVAAALRNMPQELSLVAKIHIQQTLSHFELKSLTASSAVQLPESNSNSF